jgi:putative radical SAM enzyme (TIGR03279 family)
MTDVPLPTIVRVSPGSPAARAGLVVGDRLVAIDGVTPRDVIDFHRLQDGEDPIVEVDRAGLATELLVRKPAGLPLGVEISDAVFDRVRTCDNHCEFCFIYQLPKGLRRTLYVKDDDYRLSFLYGNFTTLTRFTEMDFERIVTEGLSPLFVSIHTTDPHLRAEVLRNRRGATSLRWLALLAAEGIQVHGQIVLMPGVNDGEELCATLIELLQRVPSIASVGVVPLGVSRYTREARMRAMTPEEAAAAIDLVEAIGAWTEAHLGRTVAYCADECYLLAGRELPSARHYGSFELVENGIGVVRQMEEEYLGHRRRREARGGFFASIDGAPALGYRAVRLRRGARAHGGDGPPTIVTSPYGAAGLRRFLPECTRYLEVANDFFGGNIAVAGLMAGEDVARAIAARSERLLLPDVCLSEGRFLDGMEADDLPRPIEVVPTDGASLREALEGRAFPLVGGARR